MCLIMCDLPSCHHACDSLEYAIQRFWTTLNDGDEGTGSRRPIGARDLFDRRRPLMKDWASYLAGESRDRMGAAVR